MSTGAQDELARATGLARSMVESYGMSPHLGPVSDEPGGARWTGAAEPVPTRHAEDVARRIGAEARRGLLEQQERVHALLREREPVLRRGAQRLLERETLSGEELAALVAAPGPSAGPGAVPVPAPVRLLPPASPAAARGTR